MGDPKDIYFAHSMRDYRSRKAERALQQIREGFPNSVVHNPEDFAGAFTTLGNSIGLPKTYLTVLDWLLRDSGGVVVLEHKGSIGRGVFEEVQNAIEVFDYPVWVLRRGQFIRVTGVRLHNGDDWRTHYGKLTTGGTEMLH
jgi:hypothetical protein